MAKKRKAKAIYRYYEVPQEMPVFALLSEQLGEMKSRDIFDVFHFHNHMEIGYCYAGNGFMAFLEDEIPYHDDMFTIIPKNFSHKTMYNKKSRNNWEYLIIDSDRFLGNMYKNNPQLAYWLNMRLNRKVHLAGMAEQGEIALLIRKIFQVIREQKEFYQGEINGLLLTLLIQVARWNREEGEENNITPIVGNSTIISPALDYISVAPEKPVKVGELANMCHISEAHFRRVFAECMNMSPVKYINQVRIRRSCEELKRTDDPVNAVAMRSGFPTLSTFNRNFRKITGVSPQQWRKNPEYYEHKLQIYSSIPENMNDNPLQFSSGI